MDGAGEIGAGDRQRAAGQAPRVGLYHADAAQADRLAAAFDADGWHIVRLAPPAAGLRPWLDGGFDLLVLNPFLGWQEPAEFIRLARSIAGSRPMLVLSDRDSLADRMRALGAGADDAVGWTGDPSEVLARMAGLLQRARLAAGTCAAASCGSTFSTAASSAPGGRSACRCANSTCWRIWRASPTGR